MSDIRFNNWKHQSGTGGVTQNAAGNVGIGSTLPASALDIGGDTNITGVTTASNFKTGSSNLHSAGVEVAGVNVLGADTPIGLGATIYNSGAAVFTGVVTATSFDGALPISNDSNDRVITATGSGVANAEANLTFDGNRLVVNNTSSNTAAHFKGAAGAGFIQITDSDDGSTAFIGVDGGKLKFQTSGSSYSDKLVIDSSGRVLIGTASLYNSNSYSNNLIIYENGDTGASIIGNNSNSNYASLYLSDTSTASRSFLEAQLGANGNFTIGTNGTGPIRFNNGSGEQARIKDGIVFVGTQNKINTSPTKFQVASNDATGSAILARFNANSYSSYLDFYKSRSNTLGTAYVVNHNDHLGSIRFYGADGSNSGYTTAAEIYGSCDGGSGSSGDMPGRITFHTRPDGAGQSMQERLRIDSGGKLWVDRTHASATTGNHPAVDIDTYANGTAGSTFATGIDFRVAGVHKKRMVVTNGSGTGGGDWIFYRDQGNNEGLRIGNNGKFGINQASPQYSMHMSPAQGESRIDLHMTNSTTGHGNGDGVQFGYQNSAGAYIWNFENTDIYFGTNNINRLIIETSASTTFNFRPNTNNVCSLGTNSHRWANIHTNDLNLSNEGNSNEVDGTWGQYTIQEGEHDLFLINRRSGKRYKFLLQEVN